MNIRLFETEFVQFMQLYTVGVVLDGKKFESSNFQPENEK